MHMGDEEGGKFKDVKPRKATKACQACRKAKRTCSVDEKPPCHRCHNQGLACIFDQKAPVQLDDSGVHRLDAMENTLEGLSGRVDRILAILGDQAATGSGSASASLQPSPAATHPPPMQAAQWSHSDSKQRNMLPFDAHNFAAAHERAPHRASTSGIEPDPDHLDTPCIHEDTLHAPVEALNKASAETAPGFVTRSPSPELAGAAHVLGHLAHATNHNSLAQARPNKRRRTTYELALAMVKEEPIGKQDLVSRGILSERVARELFNTFLTHCLQFAPFLDPANDTFEDLRDNSPLCFNAVMTVTARAEKLPPEKGSLSQVMSHTIQMARSCVFSPNVTISDIQAISLLSTWNSHGYVPSGLATRMALDMHYDTAIDRLAQLVQTRTTPAGLLPPSPEQQRQERELLVQARLFCHLFYHDLNQAQLRGRRLYYYADIPTYLEKHKVLLNHRDALVMDVRMAAMLALTGIRTRIVSEVHRLQNASVKAGVAFSHRMMADIERWYQEYDAIISAPFESFARKSLLRNMLHAKLMLVCCACKQEISGDLCVRSRLSDDVKELLLIGQQSAEQSVSETCFSPSFIACFKYAGHSTYIDAAFAGLMSIRLAQMFPDEVVLGPLLSKVEKLADIFKTVPDAHGSYRALRYACIRGRRHLESSSAAPIPTEDMASLFALMGNGGDDNTSPPSSLEGIFDPSHTPQLHTGPVPGTESLTASWQAWASGLQLDSFGLMSGWQ